MPGKGQKSSATSGTRKKHAKRAASGSSEIQTPPVKEKKPKGKEKAKRKAEPKKKIYIPPVKPRPVQPDPLDTQGIAYTIPSELLVVLRLLGKKDAVTKARALEELQSAWIARASVERENEELVQTLIDISPVWFHHAPMLFLHPSKRIRLLSAGLHSALFRLSPFREHLFLLLQDAASDDQIQTLLGSWCMVAYDVDVQVSASIRPTWEEYTLFDSKVNKPGTDNRLTRLLVSFIQRAVLDPGGCYSDINPIQPVIEVASPRKSTGRHQFSPVQSKDEGPIRSQLGAEEEFETEQERKARLRIGAMGGIRWLLNTHTSFTENSRDDMNNLFSNPLLWTALYHGEIPPFVDEEGFGHQQPGIRKAAWSLLLKLLQSMKGQMEDLLSTLSVAVLRSAWVEPDLGVRTVMWQPLLMFLREYPRSWEIDSQFTPELDDSNSESGEEHDEPHVKEKTKAASGGSTLSRSYREFLEFLELGCLGSPRQGYPSILVILSTIPPSIMIYSSSGSESPLSMFFSAFWAAIDARALTSLDRVPASTAFLSSLLECTTFLSRRLCNSPPEVSRSMLSPADSHVPIFETSDALCKLLRGQYSQICAEIGAKHLKLEYELAGQLISGNLDSLEQIDQALFDAAWDAFSVGITTIIESSDVEALDPLLLVIKSLYSRSIGLKQETVIASSIGKIALVVFAECQRALTAATAPENRIVTTTKLIDLFGESLLAGFELSTALHSLVSKHVSRLVSIAPLLLLCYFIRTKSDPDRCRRLWHEVLVSLSSLPVDNACQALQTFLKAAKEGLLPAYLTPARELDDFTVQLLSNSLAGQVEAFSTFRSLLDTPGHFISDERLCSLLDCLVLSFTGLFQSTLHDRSTAAAEAIFRPLDLISSILVNKPELSLSLPFSVTFIPEVFLLGYLICGIEPKYTHCRLLARTVWAQWSDRASGDLQEKLHSAIGERLRGIIADVRAAPSPDDVLRLASKSPPAIAFDVVELLPSRDILDKILDTLPADPIDPSLAVTDPLVFPTAGRQDPDSVDNFFDIRGYSSYARMVGTLLTAFTDDRPAARKHPWVLRHFISLSIYADELTQISSAPSSIFDCRLVSTEHLQNIKSKVQQVTTYLLSAGFDNEDRRWHENVVFACLSEGRIDLDGEISKLVVELVRTAVQTGTFRESRVLHIVLQHVLSGVSKEEADHWMILARKLEKSAPLVSMSIVLSVTQFAPEPPRLERYRNELASAALGVHLSQINSEGLAILRKLSITAPDPDSEVVFLPQNRAVNLVKTCQKWAGSDDDIDEAIDSEMTFLFFHLAPILQHVTGSHWDFIFDVVENNLENCSLGDGLTLVTLARSLKVVIAVEQLVISNRALRGIWQERQKPILTLIRNIVAVPLPPTFRSMPLSLCRELSLSIVQDLPRSLIEKDTLANMCHLLADPSIEVQKMAYQLLHASARKRTEDLVIEAGVSIEAPTKSELPLELVDFLQQNVDFEEEVGSHTAVGYMLGWMILFDLFIDSSLKVKLGYTNHLGNLGIITSHFLPSVLTLLDLYGGVAKALKLELWSIDEYYIQLYDPENPMSLQLLAAHLYYRALLTVPVLIRSWLLDCKDRQLSTAVTSYTSRHFSPTLVKTELARVKGPEGAELDDEHMTIKVIPAANEVTASYSVDEHQIEMTLKIPSDWPLHAIETKDFKKVAIKEERWRAWLLGIKQITWSQNGSIVDGLGLFKRNVAGHFAGLVECAICYSIISAMNTSLPNLPCTTCNNRFHAGCLYEWFSSSHSSSCPLCRSPITVDTSLYR